MKKILRIYIGLVSLVLLSASVCNAQLKTRTLDESNPQNNFPNPPIAIVSRRVNDKPVTENKVFADKDWLQDLTLVVKNISLKPIVKFQILLTIAKQGKMPYDAGMSLSFPQPERVVDGTGKPTGAYKPLTIRVLQPGETVKVQVWEHQLQILEDIKKQDVTDVDYVSVSIRQVVFDDGTGWLAGVETRADPDNPKGQKFVRPEKPEQSLREQFSNWLNSFGLISTVIQPTDQLDRISSGFQPVFLPV